jgi:hypothetical protein
MPAGTIVTQGLTKIFHTAIQTPGVRGAVRDLVHARRVAKVALSKRRSG